MAKMKLKIVKRPSSMIQLTQRVSHQVCQQVRQFIFEFKPKKMERLYTSWIDFDCGGLATE